MAGQWEACVCKRGVPLLSAMMCGVSGVKQAGRRIVHLVCGTRCGKITCLTRVSSKIARQECPATVLQHSVKAKYRANVSYTSALQVCVHKSVPQVCSTRVSHKIVRQECHHRPSKVSLTSVQQGGRERERVQARFGCLCVHSGSSAPFICF